MSNRILRWAILFLIGFHLGKIATAQAAEIPDAQAVRAILGEARGEGYEGMLAVAEAIRNRAKQPYYKARVFHGVYGLDATISDRVSPDTVETAKRAWRASQTSKTVGEAYVWGNAADVEKFKRQKWFKNMRLVRKIGGHYFFEEK